MNRPGRLRDFSSSQIFSVAVSSVLIFSQFFIGSLSRRGLDTTDEGYYMNSIHWAEHYRAGLSGFGDFYSILYVVLGQDFGALREFNFWLSWLIWAFFGWFFASYMIHIGLWALRWDQRIIVALIGGAFSGFSLLWWNFTPSYNSLALQGSVLFAIGLLINRLRGNLAIPILSSGLIISFIGKPSTTVGLVILLLIAVPPKNMRNFILFSATGAVSLFMLFMWALYLDNSIVGYAQRLYRGFELTSAMDGGQVLWEGRPFYRLAVAFWPFTGLNSWSIVLILTAVLALSMTLITVSQSQQTVGRGGFLAVVFGFSIFSTSIVGILLNRGPSAPFQLIMIVLLSVVLMSFWVLSNREKAKPVLSFGGARSEDVWKFSFVLFLIPFAYAFGTNNNYWSQAAAMGGMLATSAILFGAKALSKISVSSMGVRRFSKVSALAGILVLAITLVGAAMFPYRQDQNIFLMRGSDHISGLYVSRSVEQYLGQLRRISKIYQMDTRTPLIDNTGNSPTAMFVLGGTPLGSAWLIGGYPGSARQASAQISSYSEYCLSQAWVLDAPNGAERVFDLENNFVMPFSFYVSVARFINPHSNEEQILYRPKLRDPKFMDPCSHDTSKWEFDLGNSITIEN